MTTKLANLDNLNLVILFRTIYKCNWNNINNFQLKNKWNKTRYWQKYNKNIWPRK